MTTTSRPTTQIDRLLTVDEGTKLMLAARDVVEDLLTIVADSTDETLWVQVRADERVVEIPIDVVSNLLERARNEVHSEAWYQRRREDEPPD